MVGLETISESTFLITELRYTLGQLHVQVLDLDPETRASLKCGDRSIDEILADMLTAEDRAQARYAEILQEAGPETDGGQTNVPLPVNEGEEQPGVETAFEHRRAQTIEILERAGSNWPKELLDAVKEQIGEDRKMTTLIAECRKNYFTQDQRPDLDKPLESQHTS
jgi:hypothetical protein